MKAPITKTVARPVRVKIPNSLFADDGNSSVCLFVRTEDKAAYDKVLEEKSVPGLKTIISLKQVKGEYRTFKDRKELLGSHTHFLCDAAVMSHLYNLLGKVFSARNKYPVPIKVPNISKVGQAVLHALDSTYMHLAGSNISLRIGHTGMSAREVIDNVCSAIVNAAEKLPDNSRSINNAYIKSSDSASLPIYSKTKNEFIAFAKDLAGSKDDSKKSSKTTAAAAASASSSKPAASSKTASKSSDAPAPSAAAPASEGKKRKAEVAAPAIPTPAPAPAKAASSKKAASAPETAEPAKATKKAKTVAVEPEAPVAVAKKAKVQEPVPEPEPVKKAPAAKKAAKPSAEVEAEVAPPAPKAATKKGKAAAAVVEEPESEPEPVKKAATRGRPAAAKTVAEEPKPAAATTRSTRSAKK